MAMLGLALITSLLILSACNGTTEAPMMGNAAGSDNLAVGYSGSSMPPSSNSPNGGYVGIGDLQSIK